MKTDTDTIDKAGLRQVINAEYGLSLTSLSFMPKGEDAYTYGAEAESGRRYFIRAQHFSRAPSLERVYTIVHALHTQHRLSQVVAPFPTHRQTFSMRFGDYTVAVFPFIEGSTLYQQGASETDLVEAATLLAAVHQCRLDMPLPKETFANPFKTPILHALHAAETRAASSTERQREVCRLLAAERADILSTMRHMEQLQAQTQRLVTDWVTTHGDPNLDNLLKDRQGILHVTDWGELATGPPERDLTAFTGESFEVFLKRYASLRNGLTLHRAVFAFYFYRWALQEIADYATRILFQKLGPVEDEHAWVELCAYLPIRHHDITQSLEEVQDVIDRVLP